jgi:hypothetical protein
MQRLLERLGFLRLCHRNSLLRRLCTLPSCILAARLFPSSATSNTGNPTPISLYDSKTSGQCVSLKITIDSKRIAVSCQTGQASFITPYRNHRGHIRPIRLRRALSVAAVIPIRS